MVSQTLNLNSMVISLIEINKVIKHTSVDQMSIKHTLLLDLKVTIIHVINMAISHKIAYLRKRTIRQLKVKVKN